MLDPFILAAALINGLTMGAVYALTALGLTLIYGVLHIINFAHGALLMLAMFAAWGLFAGFGIEPYLALPFLTAAFFVVGYGLQRYVIAPIGGERDETILLTTLAVAIVIENGALAVWRGDTRTVDAAFAFAVVDLGFTFVPVPRLVALAGALGTAAALGLFIARTDTGRAIRAVARERHGARLVGIDVARMEAVAFGIGTATLGAAACLLLPMFYVNPQVGNAFVLIAFTVVVLGGMGSFTGALLGGLLIGVIESFGGLWLGESLGQIGIFVLFVLVLLLRPTGLFGARA